MRASSIAIILLTLRFWNQAGDVVQAILLLMCLIIPVIQPVCVYLRAKAQVSVIPQGTELVFAEDGIQVTLGDEREHIPWNKVRGVSREAGIVIVYTDASHGYMLTPGVLGAGRADFYRYVETRLRAQAPPSKRKS